MSTRFCRDQHGLIALISVMIIAAFIVTISLGVALLNADDVISSGASLTTRRSEAQAAVCVDNLLARLRLSNTVNGDIDIAVNNVNCQGIITGSGNARTLRVYATTTDGFNRNIGSSAIINVNIATNPFTITRYKDIIE